MALKWERGLIATGTASHKRELIFSACSDIRKWMKTNTHVALTKRRSWILFSMFLHIPNRWCTYMWLIWLDENSAPGHHRSQCWVIFSWTLGITLNSFMMASSNGNILRVTGHLCREFTGHRWIPRATASDAELWCFLWSAPEWTVE